MITSEDQRDSASSAYILEVQAVSQRTEVGCSVGHWVGVQLWPHASEMPWLFLVAFTLAARSTQQGVSC